MKRYLLTILALTMLSAAAASGQITIRSKKAMTSSSPSASPEAATANPAAKEGIHLSGASSSSSLTLADGAGYRWDINSNGAISGGSNNAYSNGMQMTVSSSGSSNGFYANGNGRLSADRREIEMGPTNNGNQINISRRIYVDPKAGYCRWIDIFENNSGSAQTLTVQYVTNVGGALSTIYSSSGKAEVGEKDWAFVTGPDANSSSPGLLHVVSSKGSKLHPQVQCTVNNNTITYNFSITVANGKPAALCLFEAQRRPIGDARKLMSTFDVSAELEKVPLSLRKIILNMAGGSVLSLGRVELPRHEKQDLAVLRNGDELLGTILNDKYTVETSFGKVELDAKRVIGISSPDADDPLVLVAMTDGQILVGKLVSDPLKIKLANGSEMSLPQAKFRSAAYRPSPERPEEVNPNSTALLQRSGQQVFFRAADGDYTYQTEYGQLKLVPDDLQAIFLDTPEGGLHRAVFRNGSVLSGLLTAPSMKLQLDLGMSLSVKTSALEKLHFGHSEAGHEGQSELSLRNEDQLFGSIADKTLTVQSKLGDVVVTPKEIAEITFVGESMGLVQIKLHAGSTVSGKLAAQTINFQLQPGPLLPVFVGHITRIVCPPPETPMATSNPTASTGPSAAGAVVMPPAPPPPPGSLNPAPSGVAPDDGSGTVKPARRLIRTTRAATAPAASTAPAVSERPEENVKNLTEAADKLRTKAAALKELGKNDAAAELLAEAKELDGRVADLNSAGRNEKPAEAKAKDEAAAKVQAETAARDAAMQKEAAARAAAAAKAAEAAKAAAVKAGG